MKNFVQPGVNLTFVAPSVLASGDGFLVGSAFAVATNAAANGAQVEGITEGVFDLPCLSTDTPTAFAAIYWDNTNKRCTTTSAGNTKIGVVTQAKANGVVIARVRLNAAF